MARLMSAATGSEIEQCAALAAQVAAIAEAISVHVACYQPGPTLDAVLTALKASMDVFQQAKMQLGCHVG